MSDTPTWARADRRIGTALVLVLAILVTVSVTLPAVGEGAGAAGGTSVLPSQQPGILASDSLDVLVEHAPMLHVVVDQRFFNRPGNQQVGWGGQLEVSGTAAQTYVVPGAPVGYRAVACESVRLDLDGFEDLLRTDEGSLVQGSGTFDFITSGRHLVCFQRR